MKERTDAHIQTITASYIGSAGVLALPSRSNEPFRSKFSECPCSLGLSFLSFLANLHNSRIDCANLTFGTSLVSMHLRANFHNSWVDCASLAFLSSLSARASE